MFSPGTANLRVCPTRANHRKTYHAGTDVRPDDGRNVRRQDIAGWQQVSGSGAQLGHTVRRVRVNNGDAFERANGVQHFEQALHGAFTRAHPF